ncbi:5-formyltetrahydrofolate cyclo-ligase [Papillibacter cinnamivorans]|uniref:5-formyltetrahydrofolate cyclo-ligase n=1 Tax=Papillibacter cinnamivorans DSM 12816 TaxID=1122930 RepID=A0A1W1ZHI8_9FIRM|nr:5-formyltetrahydrofolate cyclo-ligase [Papillibacter cinnamivorans]SMC47836.1 5-formyltetrahydrofolate cyclo-ligase [Papillibacter cinnamivorans DSM 12816]
MHDATEKEKAVLRRRLVFEQEKIDDKTRERSDGELFARLRELREFREASVVFLYVGTGAEPNTAMLIPELLAAGKRAAVPLCRGGGEMEARLICSPEELRPGRFGILEPGQQSPNLPPDAMDFILVPALCFDREGFRLGRGGGYYDRYLQKSSAFSAGLCRGIFLRERLVRLEHDRRVDAVITEKETIRPGIRG